MAATRPVLQSITSLGANNVSMNMTFVGGFVGNTSYAFSLWTTAAPTDDPLTTGTEYPAHVVGLPSENNAVGFVPGVLGGTYYIWSAYKINVNGQWIFNSNPPTTVVVPDVPSVPSNMTFVSQSVVPGTGNIVVITQADVTGQTGVGPITQGGVFTFTNTPPPTDGSPGATSSAGGNLWNSIFTVPQNQTVYFWASSTNVNGTSYSLAPLQYNSGASAPVSPPGVPILSASTDTSVSVRFDTAGQTGQPTPTYTIFLATTTDPNGPGTSNTTYFVSGTIYGSGPVTISPSTNYYIFSKADNGSSSVFSTTYLLFNTGSSQAPSAPPAPAVVGTPTTESITVSFDTAAVTGTAPISYTCFGALDPTGPFDIPTSTTNIGSVYTSVANRLTPNTNYVFQAYASNSVGQSTSSVSAFIKTLNDGPSKAPTVPVVHVSPTSSEIVMAFSVEGITSAFPITYSCKWSTSPTGPFSSNAPVSGINPNLLATAFSLTPNTTFYFVSRATSNGVTLQSGVSAGVKTATPSTNPNDFAYYPPRPWDAPNPVYVNGISQPWRRT